MSFRYLEDIALADIAFEAESPTMEGVFAEAAKALCETMVDTSGLKAEVVSTIELSAPAMDRLLFDWLAELILLKDTEYVFFREFDITISERDYPKKHVQLKATAKGDRINPGLHVLRNDVKAVTMHQFKLEQESGKCTARVVLDI